MKMRKNYQNSTPSPTHVFYSNEKNVLNAKLKKHENFEAANLVAT